MRAKYLKTYRYTTPVHTNITGGQCFGSGSAQPWVSWIRIRIGNADPDPEARKWTKMNKSTWFPAFKIAFCTYVRFVTKYGTYINYKVYFSCRNRTLWLCGKKLDPVRIATKMDPPHCRRASTGQCNFTVRRLDSEHWTRMRSSLVVRASDCQCTSCNGPGFDPSIRRHSGIWGAADEAVLNIVWTENKKSLKNIYKKRTLNTTFTILFVVLKYVNHWT